MLYLKKLDLPDDIEIIFMDDGSIPPLSFPDIQVKNFSMYPTNNYGLWTGGLARNKAVKDIAKGEYVLCTDLDHIISKEAFQAALEFTGDKMIFFRHFAVLDEEGNLTQDMDTMVKYGFQTWRFRRAGFADGVHGNTWCLKRSIFLTLGGYNIRRASSGLHTMGEDRHFNKMYINAFRAGNVQGHVTGPHIYVWPLGKHHISGDVNPFGLWHDQERNELMVKAE